jgi:hypothetical protein
MTAKRNIIKRILPIILILVLQTCTKPSEEIFEPDAVKNLDHGIITAREAFVRIAPFVFSTKIYDLYEGNTVRIIGQSAEEVTIGRNRAYWYRVIIDNGMTGWIYGANMTIVGSQDRRSAAVMEEVREREKERIYTELVGKWWSVNQTGGFTNRIIELHPNRTYRAYLRDRHQRAIEGEYSINYENSELELTKGNPFNAKIKYVRRGVKYTLIGETERGRFDFALVSKTIEPDAEPEEIENETEDATETQ